MDYYNNSKQALDDLISDLQNDNGILLIAKEDIESELDYANSCHKLEEDLGCPFDVVLSAQKNGIIFKTKIRNKDYELCSNDYTLSLDYIENVGWVFHINADAILVETLKLSDHNKTWWVKK